jgi:hypothetical protein
VDGIDRQVEIEVRPAAYSQTPATEGAGAVWGARTSRMPNGDLFAFLVGERYHRSIHVEIRALDQWVDYSRKAWVEIDEHPIPSPIFAGIAQTFDCELSSAFSKPLVQVQGRAGSPFWKRGFTKRIGEGRAGILTIGVILWIYRYHGSKVDGPLIRHTESMQ